MDEINAHLQDAYGKSTKQECLFTVSDYLDAQLKARWVGHIDDNGEVRLDLAHVNTGRKYAINDRMQASYDKAVEDVRNKNDPHEPVVGTMLSDRRIGGS